MARFRPLVLALALLALAGCRSALPTAVEATYGKPPVVPIETTGGHHGSGG